MTVLREPLSRILPLWMYWRSSSDEEVALFGAWRHTPDPTALARPCGVFVEFAPDLTSIRWFVAAQCTALSVNYADFSVHALVCCSATLVEPAPVNDAGHDLIHAPSRNLPTPFRPAGQSPVRLVEMGVAEVMKHQKLASFILISAIGEIPSLKLIGNRGTSYHLQSDLNR